MDSYESNQQPTELELEEQRAGYDPDPDGSDDLFGRLYQTTYAAPIRPFHPHDAPDEPDTGAEQAPETAE